MCGRFTQKSELNRLGLGLVHASHSSSIPHYNAAPGQDHWIVRENPETRERTLDRLFWGLIPHWTKDPTGGRKPINAKAETISKLPSFRDAYRRRRCLVPIDSFFEWKAIKGSSKQPYAIAMKSGEPFALAGIWENWQDPETNTWLRSFAVITTAANSLVASIHDRMPVIVPPEAYDRWLSATETDPHDLLRPFPADLMLMWPISTRVNKPANDDASNRLGFLSYDAFKASIRERAAADLVRASKLRTATRLSKILVAKNRTIKIPQEFIEEQIALDWRQVQNNHPDTRPSDFNSFRTYNWKSAEEAATTGTILAALEPLAEREGYAPVDHEVRSYDHPVVRWLLETKATVSERPVPPSNLIQAISF